MRAKRQYAIAKRLLDNDNCMAMSDLLSDKKDKSALKTLIDKTLIEIFRQMPVATEIAAMPQLSESQIAAIEKLDEMFAGEGRVLIRPSGTEPKVRVMIEGKDQALIDAEAKKLADLIQNTML